MTSASTARISSGDIGRGWLKSKRSRSGATSEPFCATCWPRCRLSAACSRWVAEWARRIRSRRADVDRQLDRVAHGERTAGQRADMHEQVAQPLLRVGHGDHGVADADGAVVADLAAGFAVERGLVGDHHDRTGIGALDLASVDHQGGDHAFGMGGGVTQELGGTQRLAQVEPDLLDRRVARALPGGARGGALAAHRGVEAVAVDRAALAAQGVLGQVEREAERIVELERHLAGQRCPGRQLGGLLLEQPQPALQRAPEAGLLQLQHLGDQRLGADQLGKRLAHLVEQHRHHAPQQRLARTQQLRVAHAAPHDPAQHIATALVGRHHAVGDQEGAAAQMVGDDLVRWPVGPHGMGVAQRRRCADQRLEHVDVVIVGLALQHGRDALEAHAGVDRGLGQVEAGRLVDLLVLHEDEVPDLDPAVAVLVRAARRPARDVGAVIVEDLRARAARAGVAHGPEIVAGADPDDAPLVEPGDLAPQLERLVVAGVDRDQEPVPVEAVFLGDQVPGELDRQRLEVVAEAEIAQHLEEGVVPGGVADIVEVVVLAAGAHAFLRGRRPVVGPLLGAGEHVLELHHAGIGEQQGRVVVRHERRRAHHLMAVAAEILEEGGADLVRGRHVSTVRRPRLLWLGPERRFPWGW